MPANRPWNFGEKLNALGLTMTNTEADNSWFIVRPIILEELPSTH
jgi:hypothetical protein